MALLRALLCLLAAALVEAVVVVDCSRPSLNVTVISLTEVQACPEPHELPQPRQQEVQIVQRRLFQSVHVRTCRQEIEKRVFACGSNNLQYGEVYGGHQTQVERLHRNACIRMHEKGMRGFTATTSKALSPTLLVTTGY